MSNNDSGDPLSKAITAGLGLITALVALFGGFAIVTGGLDRLLRDSPKFAGSAIVFATLAAALYILALTHHPAQAAAPTAFRSVPRLGPTLGRLFGWITLQTVYLAATVFFIAAVGAGIAAIIDISRIREQPAISGSLTTDSGLRFKGTVHVSGVRADEHIQVRVYGIRPDGSLDVPALLRAEVGPAQTGVIDYAIDSAIPPGKYGQVAVRAWVKTASGNDVTQPGDIGEKAVPYCNLDRSVTSSCLVIDLPSPTAVPQLSVNWSGTDPASRSLDLKVSARNLPDGKLLALSVRNGTSVLYAANISPDQAGSIDTTIQIPMAARSGDVCATATVIDQAATEASTPTCTATGGQGSAWVAAAIPSSS